MSVVTMENFNPSFCPNLEVFIEWQILNLVQILGFDIANPKVNIIGTCIGIITITYSCAGMLSDYLPYPHVYTCRAFPVRLG